jgi:hypothetical protein
MKKIFGLLSFLLFIACITSCSHDVDSDDFAEKHIFEHDKTTANIMAFHSKAALEDAIKNGIFPNTRASGEVTIPDDFVSLMNEVPADAAILDSLTEEEKDTILQNHLTYYEAFDLEDLIPNENLAALLNTDCEIILGDSVFRITEYGTLCANVDKLNQLRDIAVNIHNININFNGIDRQNLSNNVSIIDTYHVDTTTYINPFKPDQPVGNDDGDDTGNGQGGDSGNDSNNPSTFIYTPWTSINFNLFPTFYAYSHTFIGHIFDNLFGERHTRHHKFLNNYRVNGSLYSYNYGFYHETGTYVSMQKKRGGLLRPFNGWKSQNADEMFIHVDSIIMEMNINFPMPMINDIPTNMKVVGTNDFGLADKQVSILGYYMSEQDVYNLMGKSLKEILKQIKTATSTSLPSNTKSFLIVTQQKVYRFIYDETYYTHDSNKLRKVYDSGVFFFISSEFVNSFWGKSLSTYLKEAFKNPHFSLKRGQVKVAGRLNNDWGGMTIIK